MNKFRKLIFLIEVLIGILGLVQLLIAIFFFPWGLLSAIPPIILGIVGFKELINKSLPRVISFLIILFLFLSLWAVLPYPAVSGYQMSNFMVWLWGFFNVFVVALSIQLKIAIILLLIIHLLLIAFDKYFNSEIKPKVIIILMQVILILTLAIILINLVRPIIFKPNPTIGLDKLKNINMEVLSFIKENYYKDKYVASEWANPSPEAEKSYYEPMYFTKYRGYLGGLRLILRDKNRKGAKIDINIGVFDSDKNTIDNFKYYLDYFHIMPRSKKTELGDECRFKQESWWTDLYLRKNNVIITIEYPEVASSTNDVPENLKIFTNKLLSDISK